MTEQTYGGPGEGWRRVTKREATEVGEYIHQNFATEGVNAVYWVREEPVPPLPTVYGAYLDRGNDLWILNADGWKAIDRYGTKSEGVSRAVATYQPLTLIYKFR